MFVVTALQEFSRKVFGYTDYYELFDGYFSQLTRDENPSLEGFSLFVRSSKGKNNRTFNVGTIVINVFGLVGAQRLNRVSRSNSTRHLPIGSDSLLQVYSRQFEQMANDTLITLRYNLQDVRQMKLSPTLLPRGVRYSWQAKKSTSVTAPMDHIRGNLVRFFTLHPFPDRLMRVLEMNDIDCVAKAINRRQANLHELVGSIFTVLRTPPGTPLILPVSEEELLLKNGAVASYSEEEVQMEDDSTRVFRSVFVFSFVDEIVKWTEKCCDVRTIQAWQTTLKVSRMIGIFPTSSASPRAQSTKRILLSLTPRTSSSSHSYEIESSFFCPFQDFLVDRTINKLFSRELNQESYIRKELVSLFMASESTRVDFLFFWQLLLSLFIELDREIQPSLKSLVDAVLPLSDQMNAYQRACLIRNRIFPAIMSGVQPPTTSSSSSQSMSLGRDNVDVERAKQVELFASVMLNGFILEHFVVKNICPEEKATLVHWLSQHSRGARKTNADFWRVIFTSKLPQSCCYELNANQGFDFKEHCYVTAWDLICLFSIDKDPHLELIESCFRQLHFDLRFRFASSGEETLNPIKSKVMRGRDLLRIHQINIDHPKYDLMDSIVCLLICKEFMNLSDAAEDFLFERLLSVTAGCRLKSIEEILQFTKNPNPLVFRERMIENIWKEKIGEATFSHYSNPIQWVEFQLEVIQCIESITGQRVSLITLQIVFLYCFYVPIRSEEDPLTPTLIEKLRLIVELRKTNFAEVESLFINPHQINEIQTLTRCLLDSNMVIPMESYTNGPHRQCLQYHQGGLLGAVQDVLIPSIPFREPFIKLAKALLDPEKREKFQIRQGLIYFDGQEQHYRNVVTTMGTETSDQVLEFTHYTYIGEWQSVLYMPRWIEGEEGRLTFEMVFWRSINQLDSRSFQIQFGYTIDELSQILLKPLPKKVEAVSAEDSSLHQIQQMSSSLLSVTLSGGSPKDSMAPHRTSSAPTLRFISGNQGPRNSMSRFFSLWNVMIESAIELQAEEHEGQLQSLANEEEERLFCLSPYVDALIRGKWDAFLEGGDECERIAKDLFRFVKEMKIKTRQALATLYELPNSSQTYSDDIERPLSDRDLALGELGQSSEYRSPSITRLSLSLPGRSSSMTDLLPFSVIDLKGKPSCSDDLPGIPLDKDESAMMLRRLESFSKECYSSSKRQRLRMCQIIGHKGSWNLTLSFNPMRSGGECCSSSHETTSSSSSSSSSLPSPSLLHPASDSVEPMESAHESQNPNEFTASLVLEDHTGVSYQMDDSFKLGNLLKHPRAHFLLKWLIDTLYQRHVREL
jgi:hypothetical protein